ncbi:unnamed protein product [Dracunculus medinensis]|uniref:Transforming growth factor beta-1-induced transcript 1 protein n=1 Tax=Dracunculus medinensis TaxID=318479 RepID=A0A0N4U6U1_DRAME|nr:unnamed protein product [Dracunculus medinensis]
MDRVQNEMRGLGEGFSHSKMVNRGGLMCKSFNYTMHSECFQCSTCGASLKNQGHHFINDKFYCDIHGSQQKGRDIKNNIFENMPNRLVDSHGNKYQKQSEISVKVPSISPTPWKTQGLISPSNRGIPTAATHYGQTLKKESYMSTASIQENTKVNHSETSLNENHANRVNDVRKTNSAALYDKIPYCKQCNKDIRGAYIIANNETWCPEHFICSNKNCNRKLLEIGFIEEKGEKYCEQCFEKYIAPHCAKCNRSITGDCLNALQKQWHPECFVCTHCHKAFGNSAFFLEQGYPYCETDWNKLFTTKCTSCNYPIEAGDRWVEALGAAFHSNCFNCTSCHTNLEGESFYAKNGAPYCKLHA